MPKFVSGSSGHIYSSKRTAENEDEDEISKATKQAIDQYSSNISSSIKKPSAVNKKGNKEQQKSSLDLFKEELRRLNEERDQQRNKLKSTITSGDNQTSDDQHPTTIQLQKSQQSQICIPLKPDPRCPTALTLQVNLNPKDKDSISSGSFDTGDPTTTNLYLGNLNPSVNENDLCDIFGKFGPLASIKVMWPRTDEERARNRNSGFVAYMSRIDAERAMRTLNGMEIRGYDLKLGWGKAVPLPQNPVFIPLDLVKLLEPPPRTGLPFNAQLHESDLRRKYKVPNQLPRLSTQGLDSQQGVIDPSTEDLKDKYNELMGVLSRSTVRVVIPQNRTLLDRIHKTIEYVMRHGPVFEAIIIARERNNPDYKFIYDNQSYEHVYYRWKLFSILHGDDPYKWRTEEFRMFDGGPIWKPPPLNPFADGMPVELIEKSTGVDREILLSDNSVVHSKKFTGGLDVRSTVRLHLNLSDTRQKGSLGSVKRPQFEEILKNLKPTRASVGSAMMFCINHSDAAQEVINCINDFIGQDGLSLASKVAPIFLISDVLHNCSAAVTNASFYRKGFQDKLVLIFENLRQFIVSMSNGEQQATSTEASSASAQQKCDNFKQKILSVLGAWREWTLYEDEFIIKLSNVLLGIAGQSTTSASSQPSTQTAEVRALATTVDRALIARVESVVEQKPIESLDGEPLDEKALVECLEKKGLSLRWYKTLELSEDDETDEPSAGESASGTPARKDQRRSIDSERQTKELPVKFKASKWETVDPNEVAEQVVRLSKWEAIEAAQRAAEGSKQPAVSPGTPDQLSGSTTSLEGEEAFEVEQEQRSRSCDVGKSAKKLKRHNEGASSTSSSSGSPR